MELKRYEIRKSYATPDYDSTKANFDELENLISALQNDRDELKNKIDKFADYTHERFVETIVDLNDHDNRLTALDKRIGVLMGSITALEAKPDYKKIDALERRINTLMGSITALEAKDAPEKPYLPEDTDTCPDCGGWGMEYRAPESAKNKGGYRYVSICGTCEGNGKVSPTCGNCKKAWRSDETTYIYCDKGKPKYASALKPACPHHERREEA